MPQPIARPLASVDCLAQFVGLLCGPEGRPRRPKLPPPSSWDDSQRLSFSPEVGASDVPDGRTEHVPGTIHFELRVLGLDYQALSKDPKTLVDLEATVMDVLADEAGQPCITPEGLQLTNAGDAVHVSGTLAVPQQVNELVVTSMLIDSCLDCKLASRLSELQSPTVAAIGEIRVVDVKIDNWACDRSKTMSEEEMTEIEAADATSAGSCQEGSCDLEPPVADLSAEEESYARIAFECYDSDGSGCISVNEFAAMVVKDKKIAEYLGFRTGARRCSNVAYRRSSTSIESTFRAMCGVDTTELTWPAFHHFVAKRVALEVDCDGDGSPTPKNKKALAEDTAARLIFDAIDADSSGKISCTELAAACIKRPHVARFVAGIDGDNGARRLSADKLFKQMDTDGDQSITFEEFVGFVAQQTQKRAIQP